MLSTITEINAIAGYLGESTNSHQYYHLWLQCQ